MTLPMILLLAIIFIAIVLFALDALPADVIGIGIMTSLVITGILTPEEGILGFGSETAIKTLGLLLLTTALIKTGFVQMVTRRIVQGVGDNKNRLFWIVSLGTAAMGSFTSNTASTAFFLPVTLSVSKKLKQHPSKMLMSMAFAAILSSSMTAIATSTNLVVSGLLTSYGLEPMGIFELTPVGIPILIVGLLYMFFIGRKMIPERELEDNNKYLPRDTRYYAEVEIPKKSPWVEKEIRQLGLRDEYDISIISIERPGEGEVKPSPKTRLRAGDLLVLDGGREGIFALNDHKVVRFTSTPEDELPESIKKKYGMAEVVLLPTSSLVGQTLRGLSFRKRFGIQVLGIQRRGKVLRERLLNERLQVGDQMLIHGDPETIASLENGDNFRIISDTIEEPKNTKKAPYALIIFVLSVGLAAANILPLAISTMIGALLIFVTRCITPAEAYKSMNWSALILIGCMLALGKAMDTSGLANYLAGQLVTWIGTGHAYLLLAGFFLLAMILTQPMSNQAAAVVVLPIAIETALQLGLNPRTFAMMIAVGAATSYITPLEPACMMVYGPGNYRFMDFVKVGSLLTILIFGISMLMVPVLWPF
ncbi:MAG TPA: SLC13 family permease [Anaerolineaceae bacterium]|nr:SLC13 family permease [Anaerolineaceae bacterium]HPS32795.1 SLC13 family permease [Anaerolineaceae bacterium]